MDVMTDPIGVGSMARKMVVVGIGCSADRLDALRHLLGNMPTGTGMVYVVIAPPASPGSVIDELVGDIALPVVEAADGTTMTADHVYVAPAGSVVTVDGPKLRVRRPNP